MVRRYYPRRRGRYRRRRWGSTVARIAAPAAGYLAMRAAKMVAKKYLNTEKKYVDSLVSQVLPPSTGLPAIYLNPVAEADGHDGRDGEQIKAIGFQIRLKYRQSSLATHTSIRTIIFQDRDFNGTNPHVWGSAIDSLLTSQDVLAMRNRDNTRRFKVLWDKDYVLQAGTREEFTVNKFIKLNTKIRFTGNNALQTSGGRNSLFMIFISDEPSNFPAVHYQFRLTYIDN